MGCPRLGHIDGGFLRVVHTKGDGHEKNVSDHFPGGMAMPGRNVKDANGYRYGFQGQYSEKDEETGLNAFELRMYDSRIGRWISPDPYGQFDSPYIGMGNNPITYADPDGGCVGKDCPDRVVQGDCQCSYYGKNGEGITELSGISDALSFGLNPGADWQNPFTTMSLFSTYDEGNAFWPNYMQRPDYDGFVTIDEGIAWAKQHPNAWKNPTPDNSLFINSAKLDFGNLTANNLVEGKAIGINLFSHVDFFSDESRATTYALGNTQVLLISPTAKTVRLFSDIYDWDYHDKSYKESWIPPSSKRDRLIWGERRLKGLNDSHGFNVYMYGVGRLR